MGKEKCWSCKRMKGDVKLRACDDRLCGSCYDKNEEALSKLRTGDNTGVLGCPAAHGTSDCYSCRKATTGVTGVLKCDICVHLFHAGCVGVSEAVLAVLVPIIDATGWVCPGCRTQSRQQLLSLQAGQANLAEEVAELKVVVVGLQQQLLDKAYPPLQPNQSHDLKFDVRCAVHSELADKDKRARNVVVSGLAPVDGVPDETLFVSLCEANLTTKPAVQHGKCRRLGRKEPGRIQPLLVTLQSSASVVELVQSAPRLRKSADQVISSSVYINHDMTVAERKLAYERRVKRRQQSQSQSGLSADATPFDSVF